MTTIRMWVAIKFISVAYKIMPHPYRILYSNSVDDFYASVKELFKEDIK